jgi:hypothetical protein
MAGRQRSGFANDRRTYTYACCNDKTNIIPFNTNLYYPNRTTRIINYRQYVQHLIYYLSL